MGLNPEQIGLEAIFEDRDFQRGLDRYIDGLGQAEMETVRVSRATVESGEVWEEVWGNLIAGAITSAVNLITQLVDRVITALGDLVTASVNTAISVESAFAGVAKTTDGLVNDLGGLTTAGQEVYDQFRDLATQVPTALEELLGIGELAGQLGVPKEALADFTETISGLAEATNLTTEEAATDIARFNNIFEVAAGEMAGVTERVGSTIVGLGNNFATTEKDILAFAENLAGAGRVAGLTQSDVLGIATALSSVGVEAAAGGTAVQKVILSMVSAIQSGGDELTQFANVTGRTVDQFTDDFEKDAGLVFQDFVAGLQAEGDAAISTLDELGLADSRLVRAFLSLSNAGDLLTRTMDVASTSFEENSALAEEVAKRYATTESQIEIARNALRDIGLEIGNAVLPSFNRLLEALTPAIGALGEALPGVLETLTPKIEAALDFLIPFIEDGIEAIPGAITGALDLLGQLEEAIIGIGEGIDGEAFVSGFEALGEFEVPEGIITILDTLRETVSNLAEEIFPFFVEQGEKVSEWFAENQETFQTVADILANQLAVQFEYVAQALEVAWGIMEPILDQLVTVILGNIEIIASAIAGDWQNVWDTQVEIVESGLENAGELLRNFVDGVLSFLDTDWESVKEVWENNWDALVIIVESVWESLQETLNRLTDDLFNLLNEAWTSIEMAAEDGWNALIGVIAGVWTAILQSVEGFRTDVREAIDRVIEAFGLDPEKVRAQWAQIFDDLRFLVSDRMDKIREGIREAWNAIVVTVTGFALRLLGVVATNYNKVEQRTNEIWDSITEKVAETWQKIVGIVAERVAAVLTTITEVLGRLLEAWNKRWGEVRDTVSTIFNRVAEIVGDKLGDVVRSVEDKIGEALSVAESFIDKFIGFGENIIEGIIEGLQNAAGKLFQSITNIISNALSSARQEAEAQSPSRKGMRLGEDITEGVALGIERNVEMVNRAIALALSGLNQPVAAPAGAGIGGGGVTNITNERTINLEAHYSREQSYASIGKDVELMRLMNY